MNNSESRILVVGSLAYDSVSTPSGAVSAALGGSANYFGIAASLYVPVSVVGVVGDDYKDEDKKLLSDRGVNIEGIKQVAGKTFHWEGEYKTDLNEARTLRTELNVFAEFKPELDQNQKKSPYVFLANIDPQIQLDVLDQIESPRLVAADTMNFWIQTKSEDLQKLLKRLDILIINDTEAKMLTGVNNTILACEMISEMGPKAVVIKRGEYGFVLYYKNEYFALPAFPIKDVVDPTGAGDTFAGGFMGYLAQNNCTLDWKALKNAAVHGSLLASYTVQDFSVKSLKTVTHEKIQGRLQDFRRVVDLQS